MKEEVIKSFIEQSEGFLEEYNDLSVWQLRLFFDILQQLRKDDKDLSTYRLYFKDIIAQYENDKKDYEYIRAASISLLGRLTHINYTTNRGQERVYHASIFTGVGTPVKLDYKDDECMYIDFSINPELKGELLRLQEDYLFYDDSNILGFGSKLSVRMYQILKSYKQKDQDSTIVDLSVAELRKRLLVDDRGEPTDQYKEYLGFKKNVLLKAQKELKDQTDIVFDFDEIKKGRRVDTIRFYVHKNRKKIDVKKYTLPQASTK